MHLALALPLPVHTLARFELDKLATSPISGSEHTAFKPASKLKSLLAQLDKLLTLLRTNQQHALLVVLQGMDASGKDGVIRNVFSTIGAMALRSEAFGPPSDEEKQHDFLWRVHQKTPRLGEIVIFNRSHYEDVLIARVRGWIDKTTWEKRYQHILHFEALLNDQNVHVLKFYLHISKQEQRERLQARFDDPLKQWKLKDSDLVDRKQWNLYMLAYQEAMLATSTAHAPWYVIPSDLKSLRDILIAQFLVHQLSVIPMGIPIKPQNFSIDNP